MAPGVAAVRPVNYSNNEASPWLSVWLLLIIVLVVAMVSVGGATRLTDSGLSITEWKPLLGAIPPLSVADWSDAFAKYKTIPEYKLVNDGMSLAQFKAIYWWEWGHRFLGRFIGVAYGLPLFGFWLAGRIPKCLTLPLFCVLLLGALQGVVGWYMVQSGLTERVDVSHYRLAMHLSLAFILLGCLVWLALEARQIGPLTRLQTIAAPARTIGLALVGLVMLQVVLGAFVAGTKAGLAYNTWPLMDGDIVPSGLWSHDPRYMNVFENLITIQFNHRMLAYILLLLATIQAFMISNQTERVSAVASAWLLCILMYAQAALGIWTLVSVDGAIPLHLGVAHQTLAAIVFAVAVVHLFTMRRPPET